MHIRAILVRVLRSSMFMFGVTLLWTTPASATNVSGNCPPGGFTAAGSPWNFTASVSVPVATTCTVQAGATLNGNGNSLSVAGTLNALGTSSGSRDVVFDNVRLTFQSASSGGTLQFCTINWRSAATFSLGLRGSAAVTGCTINSGATRAVTVTGEAPLIAGNTIAPSTYGVYVESGTPTIRDNAITATIAGIYFQAGGGTASGNTIGFGGSLSGRAGIQVSGSATSTIAGNTILDDPARSDTGIRAVGTKAVQIVNNTLHASGGDQVLELNPTSVFAAEAVVGGNSFPDGLGNGIELTDLVSGTVSVGILDLGPGVAVDTYVVRSLSVAAAATLTIEPGVTLTGNSPSAIGFIVVLANATLNAVGTSSGSRDVVFDNVRVTFQSASSAGTLQFCTIDFTSTADSSLELRGSAALIGCTISSSRVHAVAVTGEAPLIEGNTIAASTCVYVQSGTPTISDNTVTATITGLDYQAGGGMASGNTIGFSGTRSGRAGIRVSGNAAPTIDGNTILDDPATSDTGILIQPGTGNTMTQILNNLICATGGDTFISVPAEFAGAIAGNVDQCPAATATPTPVGTATPTPVSASITGECRVPGSAGLGPCAAGTAVTLFRCTDTSCATLAAIGSTATDAQGRFAVILDSTQVVRARLIIEARGVEGRAGSVENSGDAQAGTPLRILDFGLAATGTHDVRVDPVSEAAVRLLEANGFANYTDSRIEGVIAAVAAANTDTNFAGQTVEGAVVRAQATASADEIVRARLGCPSDCNLDGEVTIDELILSVNVALGQRTATPCEAADSNGNGEVTIDEILDAVNRALSGCFVAGAQASWAAFP